MLELPETEHMMALVSILNNILNYLYSKKILLMYIAETKRWQSPFLVLHCMFVLHHYQPPTASRISFKIRSETSTCHSFPFRNKPIKKSQSTNQQSNNLVTYWVATEKRKWIDQFSCLQNAMISSWEPVTLKSSSKYVSSFIPKLCVLTFINNSTTGRPVLT